jgi:hypothetical protein
MKRARLLISILFFGAILSAQAQVTTPLSFDGNFGGCGNIFVFRTTKDKTKVLGVRVKKDTLALSKTPQTFSIGSYPDLEVFIDDYGKFEHPEYCTDVVIHDAPQPNTVMAVSGRVTIFITAERVRANNRSYTITVKVENVSFPLLNNNRYYIEKVEIRDVEVGWYP